MPTAFPSHATTVPSVWTLPLIREAVDMVRYRDVFGCLVMRDFKGRYRAKMLGIFWSIGDPLIMMFIFTMVFTYMFERSVYAYPVVLLLGLTPHRFFANGVTGAANSLLDYSALVKRVAFPRHLLPPAVLASHLIHFFIELGLVGVVSLFFPQSLRWSAALVWLPLVLCAQLVWMTGAAFLTAALNVWFRDVQYLLRSGIMVLYWLTPIFYPADFIPERFVFAFRFNPMAGVVIGYRRILMEGQAPDFSFLAVGAGVSCVLLLAGLVVFRRCEGTFADYV